MSYKPSSRNYGKISLSGELDKFAKDKLFPSTVLDEIYRGIEFLDKQLPIFFMPFSKERKNSSKYKQAIKQVQLGMTILSARQSKIMLSMQETKTKEFRQQTINFANMVQQYSFNFRKRHVRYRPGRKIMEKNNTGNVEIKIKSEGLEKLVKSLKKYSGDRCRH